MWFTHRPIPDIVRRYYDLPTKKGCPAPNRSPIEGIPAEVWTNHVLPRLDLRDLIAFRGTCRGCKDAIDLSGILPRVMEEEQRAFLVQTFADLFPSRCQGRDACPCQNLYNRLRQGVPAFVLVTERAVVNCNTSVGFSLTAHLYLEVRPPPPLQCDKLCRKAVLPFFSKEMIRLLKSYAAKRKDVKRLRKIMRMPWVLPADAC
jgi:hypothetical protein